MNQQSTEQVKNSTLAQWKSWIKIILIGVLFQLALLYVASEFL